VAGPAGAVKFVRSAAECQRPHGPRVDRLPEPPDAFAWGWPAVSDRGTWHI
jgi:hypothetical protein